MRFDPTQGRCHPDAAPSASAFGAERPMPPHVDILGHPVPNLSRLGLRGWVRPRAVALSARFSTAPMMDWMIF